ncbi:hypothetical protein D3C84_769440 [compost metagenome]
MPTRQRHLQRQPLGKFLQHGHGLTAKSCHRADATEQLDHQNPLAGFAKAIAVAQELVDPAGDLQREGGGQGWNRMGSGNHEAIALPIRQHRQFGQQRIQCVLHRIQHVAHFQ